MKKDTLFVTLFGIDGSGKSTVAESVRHRLTDRGITVVSVWNRWEPLFLKPLMRARRARNARVRGGSEDLSSKRRLLRNRAIRRTWLECAAWDYSLRGVGRVKRVLREGDVVLCDRYTDDFVVDQAVNLGGDERALIEVLNTAALRRFPRPDISFLIDVEAETALSRKNDGLTLADARRRVALYRRLAELNGAVRLGASGTVESVSAAAADLIVGSLADRGVRELQ